MIRPCSNCLYMKYEFHMGKRVEKCLLYPIFHNYKNINVLSYQDAHITRQNRNECGPLGKYYSKKLLPYEKTYEFYKKYSTNKPNTINDK